MAPPGIELRIGPYVIEHEVGRGGQGTVFAALDSRLHRRVAIKILPGVEPGRSEALIRFKTEAEITSSLEHPGICAVYDADLNDAIPFVVMRFVEGETLASRIRGAAEGDPPAATGPVVRPQTREHLGRTLRFMEQAARAFHAAHEAGVVHRDVKPGNLMVSDVGEPVVLDFGLASMKSRAPTGTSSKSGTINGSPYYMSPEQILGDEEDLDRRTDVYSLGATLYECLAGRRPFEAATQEDLFQKILTESPLPLRELNPALPRDVVTVVQAAVARDAAERYPTAAALADDLRALVEGKPIRAAGTGSRSPLRRILSLRRRKAMLLGVFLLLALGAGIAGFLMGRSRETVAAPARDPSVERALAEGFALLDTGERARVGAARAAFEQALAREPGSVEAITGLATATLLEGRPERAIALLDETRADQHFPALARLRVEALLALDRPFEALALDRSLAPPSSTLDQFVAARLRQVRAAGNGDEPEPLRTASQE